MKRVVTVFVGIGLLVVSGAVGAQKTQILVWGGTSLTVGTEELLKELAVRYPDIEVTFELFNPDDIAEKFLLAMAAGTAPDIVTLSEAQVVGISNLGALMSLDAFMANDPDVSPADWVPMVYQSSVVNGILYALPITTDVRGLFYNKRMFGDAGLDPDQAPKTWDDLAYYARLLTRTNSDGRMTQLGINPLDAQGTLYFFALANGAKFLSEDGRSALLNRPEVIEAMEYIVHLYDTQGGYDPVRTFGSGDRFLNQQVAMRINGNWRLNTKAADPRSENLDWGLGWMPVPADRYNQTGRFAGMSQFTTWSAGWRWAISSSAADPGASWKVLKFLASVDGHVANARGEYLQKLAEGQKYVPRLTANIQADRTLAEEYLQGLPQRYFDAQWFFADMLEVTQHRPNHPLQQELVRTLTNVQNEVLRSGIAPANALENAQRSLQGAIDQYFANQQ